jgi:hypothetical protein
MEDETSEETAAPIWVPVKELLKSALEWSTVKKGDLQGKGRPRLECLFCGAVYTGGPSDIRLHLDVFGSGTGGKKCGTFHGKPVKPEMKERKREVKEELDRRAKKEDEHAKQVQKVEQAKAVAMEGQSTLDKYKTTPEMCDEAFAKAAAYEITDFEESLLKGAGMLNAQFAFSDLAKQQPLHRWAATYLSEWPILCDFVKRLHSVPCSASACEHAWSIQGWFTSKRRNRLRETVLQRLMRMHANLLMLDRLNQLTFKDGPLAGQAVVPWDLECEIPEPYEGCEGGESDEEDDSD